MIRELIDGFSQIVSVLTSLEVAVYVLVFLIAIAFIIVGGVEFADWLKRRYSR